jgi:anti-anti-sigma factor
MMMGEVLTMEITENKLGQVVVFTLNGKLNTATYQTVHDRFIAAINAGEKFVLVDMSRVDFMSSVGLRVFFMAARDLQRAGGTLIVCSPQPDIKRTFEISGFPTPYPITATREEALVLFPR